MKEQRPSTSSLVRAAEGLTFCRNWRQNTPQPPLSPPLGRLSPPVAGDSPGLGVRAAWARWACEREQELRMVTHPLQVSRPQDA